MNCPMCGAPLGDNDFECSKCFTKRSEMGPAYNNNGGSSYQSGGYGNNSYGNTGYGNGSYGNSGNQNNGYGTSYNTSYGSTNNYGSSNGMGNYGGMGYTSTGARVSNPKNIVIAIILVVVFVIAAIYGAFIRPNSFKTFDMGDFKVSLPANSTQTLNSDFDLSGMGEGDAYNNGQMEFAYMCMDLAKLGLTDDSQKVLFKKILVSQFDSTFSSMYKGYVNLTQPDDDEDMMKFRFNNDRGIPSYVEMKIFYENNNIYMVVCMCDGGKKAKLEEKFDKIFSSIEFK